MKPIHPLHLLTRKTTRPVRRQKLAATPRRAATADEYDDEPNMRLSSAFLVVLLLHVVAVGGIYAFNRVKVRQTGPPPAVPSATAPSPAAAAPVPAAHPPVAAQTVERSATPAPRRQTTTAAEAMGAGAARLMAKIVPGTRSDPKPGTATAAPSAVRTYTVVKGDNPVTIAKRFAVNYEELLKLNHIEDPRKLQIGQVLKIPASR